MSRARIVHLRFIARGVEQRVTAKRIALEVDPPGAVPGTRFEDRRAAGDRVDAVERRVREHAGHVDVALLWEIVREADDVKAGRMPSLTELAAQDLQLLSLLQRLEELRFQFEVAKRLRSC